MKKLSSLLLFLLVSTIGYSQGVSSNSILEEITESELLLSSSQNSKLNLLKSKAQYNNIRAVKIGNIQSLQQRGGVLPVKIPGVNKPYLFKATRIEVEEDGSYIWEGKLKDEEGLMSLYYKNNSFFGQINIGNRIFQLKDLGEKKNILIEIDSEKQSWQCGHDSALSPSHDILRDTPPSSRSHCHVVSVLVLYTPEADATGDPENDAIFFIDQSNQAMRNNNIAANTLTFVLAGVEPFDIDDTPNNIGNDLDDLRDDPGAIQLRNNNNADLVVLLTDANYWFFNPAQGCNGPGDCIVFGVSSLLEFGQQEDGAWAIVEIDAPNNRFTFPHEVAHNFGARHEIQADPNGTNEHGHQFVAGGVNRATIMARTFNANQQQFTRIHQFSNPNQQFLGVPTGQAGVANNAQHVPLQTGLISSYRTGCLELQVTIAGPTNLSNGQSGTWIADISNCPQVTNIQWAKSSNGLQYTNIPGSTSVTTSMITNSNMYLRVSVTCDDGQTDQAFYLVLNPDAENCDPCLRTKKKDNEDPIGIIISPNPADEEVVIDVDISEDGMYEMYLMDAFGKKENEIFSGFLKEGLYQRTINLSDKRPGVKFVVVSGNHNIFTKKMLVL